MTRLIAMDIDETQIPERSNPRPFDGEELIVKKLKMLLENKRRHGEAIVVHVSNGMRHLFDDVESRLAEADYLTCDASTKVFKRNTGGLWEEDIGFKELVNSCDFSPSVAEEILSRQSCLVFTGSEHQTPLKRSATFSDLSLSYEGRMKIFREVVESLSEHKGMKAFYIEGHVLDDGTIDPKGPFPIIDVLPKVCTKGECIKYIAISNGIPLSEVLTVGNGDNDVSMMRGEFRTVAVGNSQPILIEHVRTLSQVDPQRHFLANGIRSSGVLEGLTFHNVT